MSETSSVPTVPFMDKEAIDEKIERIRDLNEKVIQSTKQAGQVSLDAYEKALQSLLEFEEKVASGSQMDWVAEIASTHAKFVQDLSSSYINAARELLK